MDNARLEFESCFDWDHLALFSDRQLGFSRHGLRASRGQRQRFQQVGEIAIVFLILDDRIRRIGIVVYISVCFMPDDELEIAKLVGNDSMMSSAVADLVGSAGFLELMAIAFEFMESDYLLCHGFSSREYCCVLRDLNVDRERLESLLRGEWIDKRETEYCFDG